MSPEPAAFGSWSSPLTAEQVADGEIRLSMPMPFESAVWWAEARPADGGRVAVVRRDASGTVADVLPPNFSARSRVHEYGGRAWLPLPGGGLVFANWTDQRLYRLDPGSADPVALTPEPPEPAGLRYADPVLAPDAGEVWWIREAHSPAGISRHLVAVPLDGSATVREIVGGSRFLASPRPSPDGRRVAWLAWEHPQMPWDGTELRIGEIGADGTVASFETVLGSSTESVLQPEWADVETLWVISDRSGWWNLYRLAAAGGTPEPLCPRAEEFGAPLWVLGATSYAPLCDGRLAVLHGTETTAARHPRPRHRRARRPSGCRIPRGHPRSGPTPPVSTASRRVRRPRPASCGWIRPPGRRWRSASRSRIRRTRLCFRAAVDHRRPGPAAGTCTRTSIRRVRPDVVGPAGELPPFLVFVHGGPTAQSPLQLSLETAYFTSRGIGVVEVNYGGSTGYGRAYRDRLRGQWGVVDVEDCVAVAQALVADGSADPARLAIRGGSAGGWTTLAALTGTDVFTAGTSYYGVADLIPFAADTHDFESRYLDGLVGPLPAARQLYESRSPLSHVDGLSCPVLLLQGLQDEVVPPSQSEIFADALRRKGIPYAYLTFDGEQHGFRRKETVIAALEAELSFYGQVFGFDPPGVPVLPLERPAPAVVPAVTAPSDASAEAAASAPAPARKRKPPARLVKLTSPLAVRMAGRKLFPLWAVLRHRGRKSGKDYAIPVAVLHTPTTFVIALPWGPQTNWARNVLAAGGATVRWKGVEHRVTQPTLVGKEVAMAAANRLERAVIRRSSLGDFLQLQR